MTNRKVVLILGATILILSFMGLVLYQSYEEKKAAQEQLQILKGREEARARAEEEKRRGEQERQRAENQRREAEIAEKQRIEQQSKFEQEELARFQAEQDKATRETKRIAEIEEAKLKEKQRQENLEKAKPLKQNIEYLMGQTEYQDKIIRDAYTLQKDRDAEFIRYVKRDRVQRAWWSYLEQHIKQATMQHEHEKEVYFTYIKGEEQKRDDMKAKLQNMNEEYKRLAQ